jgi:tetratricopeptide (TPR) repeat protein
MMVMLPRKSRCLWSIILFSTAVSARSVPSFLQEANDAYGKGALQQAVTLYKKAYRAGENPTLVYFNLGNCYFQLDSLPQSIVFYRAAVNEAPDFFRGHLNLSIAYYSLEDFGNCIASVSRALELQPDDGKALLIRAAALRKAGGLPESIIAFEQLYQRDDSNSDACIALGEMYRELGDDVSAAAWFDRYPETGANTLYVFTVLAEIYEQQGNYEKTLYYLQRAKEIDPANRWLHYRICLTHEKMGNKRVAYEEAQRSLSLFPDFGDLALFAGNCAFSLDLPGEAEHYYTMAKQQGFPGAVVGLENIRLLRNREASVSNDTPAR